MKKVTSDNLQPPEGVGPAEPPQAEHGESADAGEKVIKKRSRTSRPKSPANPAVEPQVSLPETPTSAKPDLPPPVLDLRATLLRASPFILIVSTAWFANFLHFASFGYYEDDWYYYPSAFAQPLSVRITVLLSLAKGMFQGRPMLLVVQTFFSYLVKPFSSISLPYILAFLMLSGTALLFYRVLRARFPRLFCTLASLLFVLSPLTTVRQDLVIEFNLGAAFIGILFAVLIRRRRPVLSYLLAILTLLTYESVFLLFLGAPLLERGKLGKRKLRELALHLTICTAILAAFLMVREAFAEQRVLTVAKLGALELLKQTVTLDLYYTFRSFWSYVYAASVSWREITLEPFLYACGFMAAAGIILFSCFSRGSAEQGGWSGLSRARSIWWLRNGCLGGLLFVVIGYLTIFLQTSGSPIYFGGRDTRFSASAVPGSSVFVVSLLMLAMTMFRQPLLKWIGRGVTILFLSVLFVYSFIVQYDYIHAWEYERNFLSQLVMLAPDLQQDGLIVVRTGLNPQPGSGPEDRPGSVGWQRFGVQVSLKCLGNWNSPEIVFLDSDDWSKNLQLRPDRRLYWKQNVAGSVTASFVPGRVILVYERADGLLTRADEMVTVDGAPILQMKEPVNLARGKPARQSSTFGQAYAWYGVDGINGSSVQSAWGAINQSGLLERLLSGAARTAIKRHEGFAGFQTNNEPNPWWEVDLGRPYSLERARIFNGQPAFYQRAATIRILLSEDSSNWRVVYDNAGRYFGADPLTVDLGNATARYVRVQLAEPNWLHLEEVEVFGR